MSKYLFIVPSLSKGGAERVVSILAGELVKQNKEAIIITHFRTQNDYFVDSRVKIICLSDLYEEDYRKKINILYLSKLLYRLRKNIVKCNPDYILPFLWTTCIRTDIALLLSSQKKKIIQTVRNNPNVFPKNRFMKAYRNFLIKKSHMTLVQNEEQKNYFKTEIHHKIKVLPNPISNSIFDINIKNNTNHVNIIGVGRLEKQKNFDMLINAFNEVNKVYSNTRLIIYGEGTLKHELQSKINLMKLNKCVKLYGRCNDYQTIYGNADIFVLSSNFEGMPNTLLEAMACGIPCISTDCPTGPKDIIDDNINGFLVKMNCVEDMKSKIIMLIENKEMYKSIKEKSKIDIKNKYTAEKVTQLLINYCDI